MQFITRFVLQHLRSTALLALLLIPGCAGIDAEHDTYRKTLNTQLEARNVLQVDVGPEVALSRAGFGRLESIIDSAGTAHLAGIDLKGGIHHIGVGLMGPAQDEVIGTLPQTVDRDKAALDIVEYPTGTIRIAAGDTEYARGIAGGEWSRTGGNPCRQYLIHTSSLFCAFVARGEVVGTPPRTDRSGGLIFVVPFWSSNTVRPGKLVIAERIDSSWVVRTVIDPATNWSADDTDVTIGVDRHNMVHVVFKAWRGGSTFVLGAAGYGGVADRSGPNVTVNYAHFPFPAGGVKGGARADWQEVQSEGPIGAVVGNSFGTIAMLVSEIGDLNTKAFLGAPYRRLVGVAPTSGVALALVDVPNGVGTTVIRGKAFELVAANGFLDADSRYSAQFKYGLLRVGPDEMQHLLLTSCHEGLFLECNTLVYVRRAEDGKFARAVLAKTKLVGATDPGGATLAIGSQGMVLAAWVVAGQGTVGRWISPRPAATGTGP